MLCYSSIMVNIHHVWRPDMDAAWPLLLLLLLLRLLLLQC
jgi:hypothetical protein